MKIVIIDCGFGNHGNIRSGINKIGLNFSNNINDLETNDILLIPGVGNFKNSIELIRKKQLDKIILDHHNKKGRIIGICLGMQLLFDYGYEGGGSQGLSLIRGEVKKINKSFKNDRPIFGWNKISHTNSALKAFDKPMYFVHSYEAICTNEDNIESTYLYQERKIVSSVKSNNVYGFQFHPERSAENGLQILKSVLLNNL
jgi:glutamine amidotransferase